MFPMGHELVDSIRTARFWRNALLQAFIIGLVTLALVTVLSAVNRLYFDVPPVNIIPQDKADLGVLCPGDVVPVVNVVRVSHKNVLTYYVTTMDGNGYTNIIGTQRKYEGFVHPRPSSFVHVLPWRVPNIAPGHYRRVFAARGIESDHAAVTVEARYEIGLDC